VHVRDVHEKTRGQILAALVVAGRSSRASLAQLTGLSKATISRHVDQLAAEGMVREAEQLPVKGRGPRRTAIELVAHSAPVCGIDLGATNTRLALIDISGRLLGVRRTKTPIDLDSRSLSLWLADEVEQLCREHSTYARPWASVVGVPGVVNPTTNRIRGAPNLPAVEGDSFTGNLGTRLDGTVAFDNDANLALIGELHFGLARGTRSAVMFTIGTGVGAGVVLDGRPYRGQSGFAGELGYIFVGRDLNFEQAVAGPGLLRLALELGIEAATPADLLALPETLALTRLRRFVESAYTVALSAAICSFEPDVIVLGGGLAAAMESWLPNIRERLEARLPSVPPIVLSALGDMAGTYGALAVGLERAYGRLGLHLDGLTGVFAVERLAALVAESRL
jgi:predicted NBD/HSP70 family sugar kinase